MKLSADNVRKKLSEKGLKVTPQRVSILEAVYRLQNHPTVDQILAHIHSSNPNIATGTVYKVLETLVEKQLIRKVKTDRDIMRYDGITEPHHHLYCSDSDLIEDYEDHDLDELLANYFDAKGIEGFRIEEVVLQIRGTYNKS
jgi:Fur family peroxide stress response transcriptional regulator